MTTTSFGAQDTTQGPCSYAATVNNRQTITRVKGVKENPLLLYFMRPRNVEITI